MRRFPKPGNLEMGIDIPVWDMGPSTDNRCKLEAIWLAQSKSRLPLLP
jgi:hypothetical protein